MNEQKPIAEKLADANREPPQRQYRILWAIEVFADDVKDAAEQALGIQRDPDSVATVFSVTDMDSGEMVLIDADGSGVIYGPEAKAKGGE